MPFCNACGALCLRDHCALHDVGRNNVTSRARNGAGFLAKLLMKTPLRSSAAKSQLPSQAAPHNVKDPLTSISRPQYLAPSRVVGLNVMSADRLLVGFSTGLQGVPIQSTNVYAESRASRVVAVRVSAPDDMVIEEGRDYLLSPDDRLPYDYQELLGHGHTGVVEKVVDRRTGAVFARKRIRLPGATTSQSRRKIFDNEVSVIRSLNKHRHIVRVFATYVDKREVGLILQPVADSGDLEDFIQHYRDGNQTDETSGILWRAFGCLATGLAFIHEQKVRHKDIKPRNILIHQGSVMYTDFGYSLDTSLLDHSTTSGKPDAVTTRYAAPEVLDHDKRNSKSDIFSLGCVFIEMSAALAGTYYGIFPTWRTLPSTVSCYGQNLPLIRRIMIFAILCGLEEKGHCVQVFGRMLQHDRADRPSATELVQHLLSFRADLNLASNRFCSACYKEMRGPQLLSLEHAANAYQIRLGQVHHGARIDPDDPLGLREALVFREVGDLSQVMLPTPESEEYCSQIFKYKRKPLPPIPDTSAVYASGI